MTKEKAFDKVLDLAINVYGMGGVAQLERDRQIAELMKSHPGTVMSKERELLRRLASGDNRGDFFISNELLKEIETILAQPEQEPVAWMSLSDIEWMNIVNSPKILELTDGRHNSEEAVNLAVKMTEEKCKKNNSDSIPKREPLSDEAVCQILLKKEWKGFVDLVRIIEKCHGIGGGE